MKLGYLCIIVMTTIQLDLLKRFHSSDARDVSVKKEDTMNNIEKTMHEICQERSIAIFEPKVVVKAVWSIGKPIFWKQMRLVDEYERNAFFDK